MSFMWKKSMSENNLLSFAKWVANEIFEISGEWDTESFKEIACRKLNKLGIVDKVDNEWKYTQESEVI